ncbi:hypothetical protein [Azospirillum argentinense]|uniref:hypothetical protein n=1 Tax=Azospirillum argentinense TaxID=2970906 RepID=UPI0032DFC12A
MSKRKSEPPPFTKTRTTMTAEVPATEYHCELTEPMLREALANYLAHRFDLTALDPSDTVDFSAYHEDGFKLGVTVTVRDDTLDAAHRGIAA